jgi:hypothetical protein
VRVKSRERNIQSFVREYEVACSPVCHSSASFPSRTAESCHTMAWPNHVDGITWGIAWGMARWRDGSPLPSAAPGETRGKWSDHVQGVASPALSRFVKGGPLSGAERGPENGTTGWLWNRDGSLLKLDAGNRCIQSSIRGSAVWTAKSPIESTANRSRQRKALNGLSLGWSHLGAQVPGTCSV